MTSIIISGYGRMGHMVEKELERKGLRPLLCSEDICGVDPALCAGAVCIDFTSPASFRANYPFIARHFRAAVVGTTGWDDIREEVFRAFSEAGTTLVYTSNFSIGVNALFAAVKKMAPLLQGYTAAIEEIHHVHKLDAPSGTAKSLAALVREGLGETPEITSVRDGEVPGIHTVTFESANDRLTLRHEAFSREGFAAGAVLAATLTEGLAGIHEFSELLERL